MEDKKLQEEGQEKLYAQIDQQKVGISWLKKTSIKPLKDHRLMIERDIDIVRPQV
jgi:hypothetical protein